MHIDTLIDLIACPRCHRPPRATASALHCGDCDVSYPLVDGVPVMLGPEQRARLAQLREEWGGQRLAGRVDPRLVKLVKRLVPPEAPFLNFVSARNLSRINTMLTGRNAVMLDLGSGAGQGAGMHELDDTLLRDSTVYLDVDTFPGVNLVGDGGLLPLCDQRFDAVLLKAVLEHVPDAAAVLREVHRVLKPSGLVYAEIPFLFEYHPNPGDYVRYTKMGLEQLFAGFTDVEVGTLVGPAAALASLSARCLAMATSLGHLGLSKALYPFYTWLTWPMSLPDIVLTRLRGSHLVAHHLYVIARRRSSELH